MSSQKFAKLILTFLILFILIPLPSRAATYDSPDCSKIDCRLLNIGQDVEITYYPAFVIFIKQVHDTTTSGESFWHGSYDSVDSGIYISDLLRHLIVCVLLTGMINVWVVPSLKKRKAQP